MWRYVKLVIVTGKLVTVSGIISDREKISDKTLEWKLDMCILIFHVWKVEWKCDKYIFDFAMRVIWASSKKLKNTDFQCKKVRASIFENLVGSNVKMPKQKL